VGERRLPIIAGAASAAVILLTIFFLVLPKMNQVGEANDRLDQAQSQQDTLQSQLAALRQAEQNAPAARETIRKVDQAIPPTADEQGFILLMQNAADQSGIDLFTVTPGTPTFDPTRNLSTIPVTITVTGSYFSITEFLFRVETLPRAAKVTTVTMTPGESSGVLGMSGTVELYTSDASAGPGSQPGPTSSGEVATGTAPAPTVTSPSPAAGG
jgi:Tfp pilus assembly protein PilO